MKINEIKLYAEINQFEQSSSFTVSFKASSSNESFNP